MTRLPDWEARLHDYLAALSGAVFVWGQLDCALFAAGAVEAMTGIDPVPAFRGRYRTAVGSARALRRIGAGTLEATIDTLFGRVRPAFAQRGDLVMLASQNAGVAGGGMVGICVGADGVFVGEADGVPGLVRFGRTAWTAAWAV